VAYARDDAARSFYEHSDVLLSPSDPLHLFILLKDVRRAGPTERWSMDFVHDTLIDGRPFRILTVVDNWSRHSPVLEAGVRMTGETVGQMLDRVLGTHTARRSITVDHGTEFQSRALEDWAYRRSVHLDLIRPGNPMENAVMGSCNGRLRDESLNVHQFVSLGEAQAIIEA